MISEFSRRTDKLFAIESKILNLKFLNPQLQFQSSYRNAIENTRNAHLNANSIHASLEKIKPWGEEDSVMKAYFPAWKKIKDHGILFVFNILRIQTIWCLKANRTFRKIHAFSLDSFLKWTTEYKWCRLVFNPPSLENLECKNGSAGVNRLKVMDWFVVGSL